MARILFVVIPEKGHINPYIAPARELARRGHEIAFYAAHDVSAYLRRAGFARGFFAAPTPPADINRGAEFAARVRDREWLRGWIKGLLVDQAERQIEPLREAIERFAPLLLVIDPMVYAGAIAAEAAGLPWLGISSSLNPVVPDGLQSELIATNRWLAGERDALFGRFGLRAQFRVCDCLSPHGTIVLAVRELVGDEPPGVMLAGPALPRSARGDETDFPWQQLNQDLPLIYMSLGSQIYYQPRMFRTAIDAVRGKPVQLVLAAQELAPELLASGLPSNVVAAGYVPQLALLRRASAFITHGGANSLMEALASGVPLLVTPICNDQFHNAFFAVQAGCGLELDLLTAGPRECWQVLEVLLHDKQLRARSAAMQRAYLRDGGKECADAAEALLPSGAAQCCGI